MFPRGKALLVVHENPFDDFNKIIRHFFNLESVQPGKRLGDNTCHIRQALKIHETAASIGSTMLLSMMVPLIHGQCFNL